MEEPDHKPQAAGSAGCARTHLPLEREEIELPDGRRLILYVVAAE